jgi:hypothetical protein
MVLHRLVRRDYDAGILARHLSHLHARDCHRHRRHREKTSPKRAQLRRTGGGCDAKVQQLARSSLLVCTNL